MSLVIMRYIQMQTSFLTDTLHTSSEVVCSSVIKSYVAAEVSIPI